MMKVKNSDGLVLPNLSRTNGGLLSVKSDTEYQQHKLQQDVKNLQDKLSNIETLLLRLVNDGK